MPRRWRVNKNEVEDKKDDGDAAVALTCLQLLCTLNSAPICDEQNAGNLK
jgi:hypothetical protein